MWFLEVLDYIVLFLEVLDYGYVVFKYRLCSHSYVGQDKVLIRLVSLWGSKIKERLKERLKKD